MPNQSVPNPLRETPLEALFWALPHLPYDTSGLGLFLNAHHHPDLPRNLHCYQPRRDLYNELVDDKYGCAETVAELGRYDFAWIQGTPNEQETLGYLALACKHLKPEAPLILSVSNKDGGSRYAKLKFPYSLSKHKCRVIASPAFEPPADWVDGPVKGENGYWTQPGIFGWNKIDAGSKLLVELMPDRLEGFGADFGAGWGYLSAHLAQRGCSDWHLYEVDRRAVDAARKNLEGIPNIEVYWQDLTKETARRNYDVIVVNPPFHRDGRVSFEFGCLIVEEAIRNLRRGAHLWMVANQHLPYEVLLKEKLGAFETVGQRNGFKVLRAMRGAPPRIVKPALPTHTEDGIPIFDEEEEKPQRGPFRERRRR